MANGPVRGKSIGEPYGWVEPVNPGSLWASARGFTGPWGFIGKLLRRQKG